jgi:hypothetical protein
VTGGSWGWKLRFGYVICVPQKSNLRVNMKACHADLRWTTLESSKISARTTGWVASGWLLVAALYADGEGVEVTTLTIEVDGDLGYLVGRYNLPATDEEPADSGKYVMCLRRLNGHHGAAKGVSISETDAR